MKKKKTIGLAALIAVFIFASVFIGNICFDKSQENQLELEKVIYSKSKAE